MRDAGELERENAALRDRLSRLSQASLRINESLDFETVLQRALDSACSLTGGALRRHHPPGRIGADTGLCLFRADSRGEPAVRRISRRDAVLRVPEQHQ